MLEVLEAFILDFELERIDKQCGIVEHVHGRDVDRRHAALSGPGSLKTCDALRLRRCPMLPVPRNVPLSASPVWPIGHLIPAPAFRHSCRGPCDPLCFMKCDAALESSQSSQHSGLPHVRTQRYVTGDG